MIHRLSKQLQQENPRHSHSYVVLSLLAVVVFAGWFIYHGVTNYAQAQSATITGSYVSPIISLNIAENEFVVAIEDAVINETVPDGTSTNYHFFFYSDENGLVAVSTATNIGRLELSSLTIDDLSQVQAYNFAVTLSAAGSEVPVVDSVTLNYTTETEVEPEPEPEFETEQHIPNLTINFTARIDYGNGVADPNLPFYFYFFKDGDVIPTHTATPEVAYSTAMDKYIGGPIDISWENLDVATYKTYLKTPKHLSESGDDIVIELVDGAQTTTKSVDIDFGTLKVGDITGNLGANNPLSSVLPANRDDAVTSSDWSVFQGLFSTVSDIVTTLLGDFNNDGEVNSHDMWPFAGSDSGGSYMLDGALFSNISNS